MSADALIAAVRGTPLQVDHPEFGRLQILRPTVADMLRIDELRKLPPDELATALYNRHFVEPEDADRGHRFYPDGRLVLFVAGRAIDLYSEARTPQHPPGSSPVRPD